MAEVVLATASEKQVWINSALDSYVRASGYKPYMGTSEDAIIRVRNELRTEAGAVINVPIIYELTGRGVVGSEVLEGNEEDMQNANDQVRINWLRNGFIIPKSTSFRTEIDFMNAGRARLVRWSAVKLRDSLIAAFQSIIVKGTADADGMPGNDTAISYAASTASDRNAYLANNSDRILFGNAVANSASLNWATSLATIDATNDKMSATVIDIAKSLAKMTTTTAAGLAITPYMTDITAGREWFVMFMGSADFNNAIKDPLIAQADRDARVRGVDTNPIFQGGDRIYNGVILREIPELLPLAGAGAAGVDVGRSFLCGLSALSLAYGQSPRVITQRDRDWGFRPGMAIEELRGQKKVSFNGVNYGIVEVLTAAVPIG